MKNAKSMKQQDELDIEQRQSTATALSDLYRRSSKFKVLRSNEESAPEGWCETDPQALENMVVGNRPLARALKRSLAREHNQVAFRKRVASVAGMMRGVSAKSDTDFDVDLFAWHSLSIEDCRRFVSELASRDLMAASVAAYVSAARVMIIASRKAGLIDRTREGFLLDELNAPPIGIQDFGRALPSNEIAALFTATESYAPWRGSRDRAILAMFVTTGMRSIEVVELELEDWHRQEHTIDVRLGKGRSPRTIPLHLQTEKYLEQWLAFRGSHEGPLFLSKKSNPKAPICPRTMSRIVARMAVCAGIEHVRTHDFRRTLVTVLLRTADAATVARLVGHKSLDTTFRYDKAPLDLQRSAIATLNIPLTNDIARDGFHGVVQ